MADSNGMRGLDSAGLLRAQAGRRVGRQPQDEPVQDASAATYPERARKAASAQAKARRRGRRRRATPQITSVRIDPGRQQ